MRLWKSALAAILLLTMTPAAAPAQDLGRVLGPIVAPVDSLLRRGARKILRPYVYRGRARALRTPTGSRRAGTQAAENPSQQQMALGQVAQPKPFWPGAPAHIADYILLSKGAGLFGHGYGAIVASMLAQPAKGADQRLVAQAASGSADLTTGAAPFAGDMDCDERSANRAEATANQLSEMLALADDQRPVMADLRSALRQAEDDIVAACPDHIPVTVSERLRTMQDRLWAMRVAASNLRAPLQTFFDALTSEQKAKLDALPPPSESSAEPAKAAMQCHALARMAPQWPSAQMARSLRLNKDQQVSLPALSETFSQMSQLMMGACPRKEDGALARLDATIDWLDAMLFAGVNMAVALDDFSFDLGDEQKARLDKLEL